MKPMHFEELIAQTCARQGWYAVYASWCSTQHRDDTDMFAEWRKAAPGLVTGVTSEDFATFFEECVVMFFLTEEGCYAAYNQIVGDDGPTKANRYDGPFSVYATTCHPDGEWYAENT